MNLETPNHPSQQGVALSQYLHRVLLSWSCRGVADQAPAPTCFDQWCPTPTSSTDHDVREKPKRSAREIRELFAKGEKCDRARAEMVQEVCRERERNFGKVILIKGESVIE